MKSLSTAATPAKPSSRRAKVLFGMEPTSATPVVAAGSIRSLQEGYSRCGGSYRNEGGLLSGEGTSRVRLRVARYGKGKHLRTLPTSLCHTKRVSNWIALLFIMGGRSASCEDCACRICTGTRCFRYTTCAADGLEEYHPLQGLTLKRIPRSQARYWKGIV